MAITTEAVLDLLKGWEIKDPEDEAQEDESVNTVTEAEINRFITKAQIRTAGYLNLRDTSKIPSNDITDEAIATWTAGLLWNKYVQKVTEGKEDNDPNTYGDRKIWEAKAMLKPYIKDNDSDNDGKDEEFIISSTYVSNS